MITIKGRIPSKKNSKIMKCNGNRPLMFPSANHKKWHEDASFQILEQKAKPIKDFKYIEIAFYAPDKRKSDLTNKAESIMDLLVDNNIIEDDNWNVVPELRMKMVEIDRENPRAEISFH